MPRAKTVDTKRVAAAAMVDLGVPLRQVGKDLGVSHQTVLRWANDPDLQPEVVAQVKARLGDRMIVSADRFLSQGLDRIKDLHPYQAVLCAGIMHDHYLRASAVGRSTGAGSITNILIQIDQSLRTITTSSGAPGNVDAT